MEAIYMQASNYKWYTSHQVYQRNFLKCVHYNTNIHPCNIILKAKALLNDESSEVGSSILVVLTSGFSVVIYTV